MYDYKTLIGILTLLIGVISYSFYFRGISRGEIKPEAYSWLIWSLLAAITFFAQITSGGGAGAWATALTAVVCLLIAIVTFKLGLGRLKKIDLVGLSGVLLALSLWYYTSNPLHAVILVIIIGVLGFVPTLEKAFTKPYEESAFTAALNASKFGLAIFALDNFNAVTYLYPTAMIMMGITLSALLLVRRRTRPTA